MQFPASPEGNLKLQLEYLGSNTSQQEFSVRIQPVNPISGLSKKQISELKRMTRKGSAKKESNTFDIMVEEAMVSDAETGA